MSVDAVIIGSGPGGSTAADVLTQAGWNVVIIEKGRNHLLDPKDLSKPASDFSNDEVKFMDRYFLGPDPFLEPRTFRVSVEEGDRSHVGEVNSIPSTVGGGGTHADGKTPRFREVDFAMLSEFGPQPDAQMADWPLSYDDLEPWYAHVENAIGVAGTEGANPFAAPRSGPFPMPSGAPMYASTISSAAAEKLGFHPYAAPTAANSVPYGGRPACNNCGFCAFLGCPIHAKGDPVALLTHTMATGRAELWSETYVSRIRTQGRQATGVDYIGPDGVERSMDAKHVIVAGGAFETPRLLLLSGIGNELVGRNLMCHYQSIIVGMMPFDVHGDRGRAVTHVHDDAMIPDERSIQAAKDAGLPWIRGGLVEHSGGGMPAREAKIYPWGANHGELMKNSPMRRHLFAFIMQGEDLPYATNTVDLDPHIKDVRGFPVARITYRPGRHELVASQHYGPQLEEILLEMGATWTTKTSSPGTSYNGPHATPVPESRHIIGTARMGVDPATSVVDEWGRVHGLDNVIVADSSVFPTSAGYGPTLTLVALSARAAGHLAGVTPASLS